MLLAGTWAVVLAGKSSISVSGVIERRPQEQQKIHVRMLERADPGHASRAYGVHATSAPLRAPFFPPAVLWQQEVT